MGDLYAGRRAASALKSKAGWDCIWQHNAKYDANLACTLQSHHDMLPALKEKTMKYAHLKILLICLIGFGFCYTGWTLLFDDPVSPEKSYVALTGGEASSFRPAAGSVKHASPQLECTALGAVVLYSVLLPCVAEHTQPRLHKAHANGRSTGHSLTNPSP